MAEVKDLEDRVKDMRAWITADGGVAVDVRIFDGLSELLIEVIRELRAINETLLGRGRDGAP